MVQGKFGSICGLFNSKGKRNLKSTPFPFVKTNSSPDGSHLLKHLLLVHIKVQIKREVCKRRSHPPACRRLLGLRGRRNLRTLGLFTLSHPKPVQTSTSCCTKAIEEMAPNVWDLQTSLQPQSTACCSQGRWSSSKPTADGPRAPESVYLAEKRSKQWADSKLPSRKTEEL